MALEENQGQSQRKESFKSPVIKPPGPGLESNNGNLKQEQFLATPGI